MHHVRWPLQVTSLCTEMYSDAGGRAPAIHCISCYPSHSFTLNVEMAHTSDWRSSLSWMSGLRISCPDGSSHDLMDLGSWSHGSVGGVPHPRCHHVSSLGIVLHTRNPLHAPHPLCCLCGPLAAQLLRTCECISCLCQIMDLGSMDLSCPDLMDPGSPHLRSGVPIRWIWSLDLSLHASSLFGLDLLWCTAASEAARASVAASMLDPSHSLTCNLPSGGCET